MDKSSTSDEPDAFSERRYTVSVYSENVKLWKVSEIIALYCCEMMGKHARQQYIQNIQCIYELDSKN